jgi:lysozyme family protein
MFEPILKHILKSEGGYVNHPADRGGPTNYGITQSTYDGFRLSKSLPTRDVKEIGETEVEDIYRTQYWVPSGAAQVVRDDPWLALVLFDFAVNSGVRVAVLAIQRLVGVKADGIFGRVTHRAVLGHLNNLRPRLLAHRYQFYADIVRRNPSQAAFILGWTRRLNEFLLTINDSGRA